MTETTAQAQPMPVPRPAPPASTVRRPRGRLPWNLVLAVFLPAVGLAAWDLSRLESLRFAHLGALALVPLALGLVVWAGIVRAPARRATLVHARASEIAGARPGLVARLRDLPVVLRLLAIALAGVGLARPQTVARDDAIELEGIDILITLDMSGSMAETDLLPNRLDAAKAVIHDFVKRRPSDRIGLVVFGRDAYTYVPATLDHGTFLRMLAELQLGLIDGRGTAIGNGLGVSLARLKKSDARSKVIILLTDGDNNAGNISPVQAATYAQKLGVRIYTVLAGDSRGSAREGAPPGGARHPMNPQLLEQIATMTGGSPYLATDTRALAQRFQSILEDLEKSSIRDRGVLYAELYPHFLWPAFGLVLAELALRLLRLRRLP